MGVNAEQSGASRVTLGFLYLKKKNKQKKEIVSRCEKGKGKCRASEREKEVMKAMKGNACFGGCTAGICVLFPLLRVWFHMGLHAHMQESPMPTL